MVADFGPAVLPPASTSVSLLSEEDTYRLWGHHRAIRGHDFIRGWVRYGRQRTDAPWEFHQMVAMALVAAAIDRNRWLDLQHKSVHPSMYLIGLAASGQRKSTPFRYATEAAVNVPSDRTLSNEYSPEALIADLASRGGLGRGIAIIDEAGRLLGTMRKRQYGEGLKDILSDLWDAPEKRQRRLMKATYRLESVYLNIVMATTLSRFADVVPSEDIAMGFLARFLLVVVTKPITRKPLASRRHEVDTVMQHLFGDLTALRKDLSENPGPMPISPRALARLDAAEEVLTAWAGGVYHSDLIEPWARRLSEYAQRLSVIVTVSERTDRIDLPQVLRALSVIDRAKEDVVTIVEELTKGAFARELDKLERFIRENPGISLRDLYRRASLTSGQAQQATDELKKQGRIAERRDGATVRYFAIVTPEPGSSG